MKILLTGGAGFIASHTAVVLNEAGHDVVIYDNFCNSDRSVIKRLNEIVAREVLSFEGDIRDVDSLSEVLISQKIETVIHFAGLKAVGESMSLPLEYYDNNVYGTLCLLQAMKSADIKTLVFSSSATVYGDPEYLPIDEAHPTTSTNPYGRTKLMIEEILNDLTHSDETWRIACLRYFNPVGAHESGKIGENPNGVPNNLMPFIDKVANGTLPHLNVFGNDYNTVDGTGVRDYIHVMDLAEGHLAALDFLKENIGWHAINLGTGQGYSVLEMVQAYEEATGRSIPYQISPRRSGDIATCYAKSEKAATKLNWYAKRSLQDMCASSWNFQKQMQGKEIS